MMKEKEEKREFWPLVLFPLWDIFWSTSSSAFYTYYIPFRISGSQESNALNGVQIGVETKTLWSLQENWTELSGNFSHLNPRCENFHTVQNHLLAHECHFTHLKANFARCESRCKNFAHHYSRCKILSPRCEFSKHQFRTPLFKVRKFSHCAKHLPGTRVAFHTPQANCHTMQNKVQKFCTPQFKVRNSFQCANSSAKIFLLLDTFLKHFMELKLCI